MDRIKPFDNMSDKGQVLLVAWLALFSSTDFHPRWERMPKGFELPLGEVASIMGARQSRKKRAPRQLAPVNQVRHPVQPWRIST